MIEVHEVNDEASVLPPKGLREPWPRNRAVARDGRWSLFDGNVQLPAAVLHESALVHNCELMAAYCAAENVSLAPHGKTTMTPHLFQLQLRHGAWGLSAASAWQARIMLEAGADRVLIANEIVTEAEIAWVAEILDEGDRQVYCYVDSTRGVELLDETLARLGSRCALPVLIEWGVEGGRAGVRGMGEGLRVAADVARSPHLRLCGVAGFEGIISAGDGETTRSQVSTYLREMGEFAAAIASAGAFGDCDEVILTAGGSAYFDLVASEFKRVRLDLPVRIILRSGCYITHADGGYDLLSPMGKQTRDAGRFGTFVAAMEVWGAVLSRPEPDLAIVGIGKRDITPDAGLLPLLRGGRRDGEPLSVAGSVTALHDQHAILSVDPASELRVGDWIALGTGHPCTTFDKWRTLLVVDDDYRVIDVVRTFF